MSAELFVFVVGGLIVLGGGTGVVISRNPVHSALSLVASLFGIAVLFVAQEAHLLAAVQVIVYTGAIVVLILFVLMLLGVDKAEALEPEPLRGQRPMAVLVGGLGLAAISAVLLLPLLDAEDDEGFDDIVLTGQDVDVQRDPSRLQDVQSGGGQLELVPRSESNIEVVGQSLFTEYVFAFEVTSLLLTIAVVGAVYLARRTRGLQPLPEAGEPFALADRLASRSKSTPSEDPTPPDEAESPEDEEVKA